MLRKQVSLRHTAPTVPICVPVRQSKANAAAGRAVKTWQGQFRTLKSNLETSFSKQLAKKPSIFQWMAWWSASLLKRAAVKENGRTIFEHTVGHRMKSPLCASGGAIVWRTKRHAGAFKRWDS